MKTGLFESKLVAGEEVATHPEGSFWFLFHFFIFSFFFTFFP